MKCFPFRKKRKKDSKIVESLNNLISNVDDAVEELLPETTIEDIVVETIEAVDEAIEAIVVETTIDDEEENNFKIN